MSHSLAVVPRIRLRAAAVMLRDGAVLLHRRAGDSFWALPGGKVEPGESGAAALVREFREELAVAVAVGRLACVAENFFTHHGVAEHEVGLYFMAAPMPGCALALEPGPYLGVEGDCRLEFAWFGTQALSEMDLRPSFLPDLLCSPDPTFRHVVHRS
jgi:ADP-ribose pyrophosphatase YjhB (NUDIX family)